MINEYLQQLQESSKKRPAYLYHASDRKVKSLKPRVTNLATSARPGVHHENAIWAAERPFYAFGLERVNLLVPHKFTEEQVRGWPKTSWLKPSKGELFIWYWNHIPTKPIYVYTVPSDGFKPFEVGNKTVVTHWYNKKEVFPLKMEKFYPRQVKKVSWKIASDKDYEDKLSSYREKNAFKK